MGLLNGLAVNEDGREQAGMRATAADYDGDGHLDIEATHCESWLPPATRMVVPAAGTRALPCLAKTTLKTTGEACPGELNVQSHGPTGSNACPTGARPPHPHRHAPRRTANSKRHIASRVNHGVIGLNN